MRHFTLGLVASLALVTGCGASDVFQCQSEVQCTLDGKAGTCEPNGYCSFADPTCPTGQRYGDQAPGGLAGGCVAPLEDSAGATEDCIGPACSSMTSSAGPASTGSTIPIETTSRETETEPTSEGTTSSSATTDPPSGSTGSDDVSSSDASSSSATGDPTTSGGTLCPEFIDEFDNGVLDEAPWVVYDGIGMMSEAGGTMRFSIEPSKAFYSFMILQGLNVTQGYAVAHLVALPQDPSSEFVLRVFDDGGVTGVNIAVTGDRRISTRVNEEPGVEFVYAADVSELWLELAFDGTNVTFSFSTDGSVYTELDSAPSPLVDPGAADISMSGGSFSSITSPAHMIELDVFEFCSVPFDG